ncbi:hypothetical protein [Thalassolituus sp. UBA3500]|uniref:hypothetical protein n=1 Tax=Thalassolituus sp. UBA3500 TaxID=1947664 RepID=UPI000C0E179E|nr:hypothetical protein [Thalassolituus sp. UBA3500]MBN56852.1 hypothetical protein [Oceanospirillaceae bacterium]|tara:strand:+ start:1311 stop:1595 length:285 start_codon:yes stop_codon:yes gene_type:complete
MSKPPQEIDGAKVLEWAWSGEKPFGVIRYETGEVATKIFGLAICQYEDSEAFYRFSCDFNWEKEQDSVCGSIAEAKDNLPNQYKDIKAQWKKYE